MKARRVLFLLEEPELVRYIVHMPEQFVQYDVQSPSPQQPKSLASGTAAPMVERAIRLLELLSVSEEGLTFSEIARSLSMGKSSVHGLLKTLERNRAIEQYDERRYILGPRIFDLAQAYGQGPNLRRIALPPMRRLAASTGQAVFLGRVEQDRIRILEFVEDERERPALSISARCGEYIPVMAGAMARVVLASWPFTKRETFLQGTPLPSFTERSITDPAQLLVAAEETARTGIGYDYEEYLAGVNAVAVPVSRPDNALVALLWIVGFASRFGAEAMRGAGRQLHAEAQAISQSLKAR